MRPLLSAGRLPFRQHGVCSRSAFSAALVNAAHASSRRRRWRRRAARVAVGQRLVGPEPDGLLQVCQALRPGDDDGAAVDARGGPGARFRAG